MKLPFNVDLSDKIAAITGGGGVLMAEFGKILAASGARVALLDINDEAADLAAESIRKQGGKAIAVKCDCLNKQRIEDAKNRIKEEFGAVNLLINGAGGNSPKGTTDRVYGKGITGKKLFRPRHLVEVCPEYPYRVSTTQCSPKIWWITAGEI